MRKKAVIITKTWNKDLEVGASIEGRYLKKEYVSGEYGETEKYVIETADGEKVGIYSSASLKQQFDNVPVESYVWVKYLGEQTGKNGRKFKAYEVEYDDEA